MDILLVAVTAQWEDRLRELLARRGHTFSVINDSRLIGPTLEQVDNTLAFIGISEVIDDAVEICRRLRAGSGVKSLQVLACGALSRSDEIQALLSAGINDILIDMDNRAELELRLSLAEFRSSTLSDSAAIKRPSIGQYVNGTAFDGSPKGYFRSSLEGKVIEVDQYVLDMLGYKSREEAMQIDLAKDFYVDPSLRLQLLTELSTEHKTHEFFCKRRDGTPMAVRVNWRRLFDEGGNFLCFEGTIQKISESSKDPIVLRIQYELALRLSNTCDLQTTLNEVLSAAMQIKGVDCGGIYLYNESSQMLELAASVGIPEGFIKSVLQYALDMPYAQYILQGKPLYLSTEEARLSNNIYFEEDGIKAVAVAPIVHQGRMIATLNLGSHTQKTILLSAQRAIEAIAVQIGGSIVRAQAETARQISQHNLQSLFDTLRDMIFVLDKTGRLLYANHVVGKRLGYSPAELLNMHVGDLHPPERYTEALDVFSQIIAGQTSLCEIPLLTKEGTKIPVETIVVCGKWGEIDAVFGVSRDLSELHRARQALHESETRFRAVFENAAIGLALSDMNGIIFEVNAALPEMLAYTPAEFIGMHFAQFTHPDDIQYAESTIREMMDGKCGRVMFEKRFIHKNGGIIWGRLNVSLLRNADGSPHCIIVMVENITDRKITEERLRESEAFLRGLFENLPDHVIVVDRNAKIIYTNHDAPGLSKEHLIDEEGFSFIDAAYKAQCRVAFADALCTRKVQRVECLDVFNQFWSCAVVPFIYHNAVEQVMVICTDITAQKQAAVAIQKEQQLLRSIIDLHERDRQITAYEIHDGIAQQVTASMFHLEAFRRLRDSDQKSADSSLEIALKLISQSVDETRRLISGLRPLILDEYGIIEAIEYLVYENRERNGTQIDFHHDVHFKRLAPPLESAVFRIVQEAVANSCRHSQSTVVSVELLERNDRLHVTVRDQGIGFNPNSIEEACFGLRSIRERARLLGGRAIIESAPGSGACITVELPMVLQTEEKV
jgi:PAS domain S-box-containing protein